MEAMLFSQMGVGQGGKGGVNMLSCTRCKQSDMKLFFLVRRPSFAKPCSNSTLPLLVLSSVFVRQRQFHNQTRCAGFLVVLNGLRCERADADWAFRARSKSPSTFYCCPCFDSVFVLWTALSWDNTGYHVVYDSTPPPSPLFFSPFEVRLVFVPTVKMKGYATSASTSR